MSTPTSVLEHRPAHIDPRIRARRIEVQRGVGRRRLRRLVDLGLVLVVAVGFAAALRTPLLDVDDVQVTGNEQTPGSVLREQSGIHRGDQLIDVDLRAAGERVAQLPWVHDVRLHRGLDGRVAIQVTERTAVAVVGGGAQAMLVDGEGRALAWSTDAPSLAASVARLGGELPRLEPGQFLPASTGDVLALAARLVGTATSPGLVLVQAGDGALTGTLASGIEVRFGADGRLDAKVRDLLTVLDQVDLTCAAVIDVRSPGSAVLTREQGCS